jgi:hypothetical protein
MSDTEEKADIRPDTNEAFVTASYDAGAKGPGGQIG